MRFERIITPAPFLLLIDAGTGQPRGGLSGVDLEGAQRVDGATLDLGAYESNHVFVAGFE